MIGLSITTITEAITKSGAKRISSLVNRQAAFTHERENLPRRFQRNSDTAPGGPLGYKARSTKHKNQKAQKFGHQKPLVFTGELENAILSSATVTATSTGSKLTARGSNASPLFPQYKKEIEAITKKETGDLSAQYVDTFALLASQPKYLRKRRRKS